MNAACVINGRFRKQTMTGVQRVADALSSRLSIAHTFAIPDWANDGVPGHLWEQSILPFRAAGSLLWSPCITGPLLVRRQVVTIHDAAVLEHPEWFSTQFALLYRTLLPRLSRRVLKIVTVSSFSRERLCHVLGIDPKHIEVVWNACDATFTRRSDSDINVAKTRYGLDASPYFITLSTIEPRKNLSLVLRAWDKVRGQLPRGTQLLIVGKGGSQRVFADHSVTPLQTDASVRFSGFVPDEDLAALLSGALGLLYPSLYEGFGLPLLEAMSCGTPVVTTRLSSLPEVAANAALYVDPSDATDLGACLIRLASSADCRAEYASRGLERATCFSWTSSAAQMDHILSGLT